MPAERSVKPLWGAAVLGASAVALFWGAVHTHTGQTVDGAVLTAAGDYFYALPRTARVAVLSATNLVVLLAAVGATWAALLAIREHGLRSTAPRLAATAIFIAASYGLCILARDVLLTRPALGGVGIANNTFPSGHVTAVVALGAGALLLTPRRRRPWALTYSGLILIEALLLVCSEAHRLSDTFGAVFITVALALLLHQWLNFGPQPAPHRDASQMPGTTSGAAAQIQSMSWQPLDTAPLLPQHNWDPDIWLDAR